MDHEPELIATIAIGRAAAVVGHRTRSTGVTAAAER